MQIDEPTIRLTLLITLSILLVVVVYKWLIRRFKRGMPVEHRAWLMDLRVAYHPQRLRALLQIPEQVEVFTAVLTERQEPLLDWPARWLEPGDHAVEHTLELSDGTYFFKLSTKGQSTVRRFHIKTT